MKAITDILARELRNGTFDEVCSVDERRSLRQFVSENGYKNFGTANSWLETPDLIKSCVAKKHSPKQTGIGRCLTEVKCDVCRYIYVIDSSD